MPGHDHRDQRPPKGVLVSEGEMGRIAEAVAAARSRPADPAEVDAVVEWVIQTRIEYVLTEAVLDGLVDVRVEDGNRIFHRRAGGEPRPN